MGKYRIFKKNKNMKLLLTSTGFGKNPEIGREFLDLIGKKPNEIKVFLVTVQEKAEDAKWLKRYLGLFKKVGVAADNISIFSFGRRVKREDLKNIDVVFVCGGNTFVYLDKIRKTGLDKMIKEFVKKGGVYFGVSAGSYVACPTIEVASWKHSDRNAIKLKNLKALNLVPFLLSVHFKNKYEQIIKNAAKKTKYPVIVLNDKQAVLVKNKEIRIIGPGKRIIFNEPAGLKIKSDGK